MELVLQDANSELTNGGTIYYCQVMSYILPCFLLDFEFYVTSSVIIN